MKPTYYYQRAMPVKIILFLTLFFSLISLLATGQEVLESRETVQGISNTRLARYSDFLKQEVKLGKIPGAVSLVMRRNRIVHSEAYGFKSLDEKSPMPKDGIFHIMSMTKPIVSVAFMMLYEEGHFQLTDPVSKYLPQFKNLRVAKDITKGIEGPTEDIQSEVTIHQLLSHTAGFSHGLGTTQLDKEMLQALYFEPQEDIEDRVNTLLDFPLIGQPGAQWHYSASPDVLSLLIERFSGKTTAEFLHERIFDPLGMQHTGYNIPEKNQELWVPVHNYNEQGKMVNSEQQLPMEGNTVFGGTHGLFSTAADYMLFCQMLLNRGSWKGKQYLSPKTLEIMTMNQVGDLYQAPGQGFGLGFGVTTDLAAAKSTGSVGQYYWGGAYCTYFFVDPEEELIALLMTQMQPHNSYYDTMMRQFVYQAITD